MSRIKKYREILMELEILGNVCLHPDDKDNDRLLIPLILDNLSDD